MAGDLNVREVAVAATPPMEAAEHEALIRAAQPASPRRPVVLHKYGRVLIVGEVPEQAGPGREGVPSAEPAADIRALAATAPEALEHLSRTERLGLDAFRLRESGEYEQAKRERPRQGEPWDMTGCLQYGAPASPGEFAAPAPSAAAPTSAYMEGSVAVGIVIVEGPTADLQFSAAEQVKVVAEVQNGLGWYASQNPAAEITFSYDIQIVRVNVNPDPNASDLEALWRDPAIAQLGYPGSWDGVGQYVEHLRVTLGTRWTYAGFFTKYPLSWFAYASIGGPRLVMDYDNDGWGPDNIDRVFAHETGHIFTCPDEYASSGCGCGGSWGRYGTPNDNCENCAPGGGVACLMKVNDFTHCRWTPSHLGWGHGVSGTPSLRQSRFGAKGNFELAVPSKFSGIDFLWRNNDATSMPWSDPSQFGQSLGPVEALTMIQSNYGSPGNLELVARVGDTLQVFWRDSGPAFHWNGPSQIATGVAGTPALIQSRFGQKGNFELAFPLAAGGIGHMWRNNDDPKMTWSGVTAFAQFGPVDALTMIQSNYGSPGNLELVARFGNVLQFFWRDSGPAFYWNGPYRIL